MPIIYIIKIKCIIIMNLNYNIKNKFINRLSDTIKLDISYADNLN